MRLLLSDVRDFASGKIPIRAFRSCDHTVIPLCTSYCGRPGTCGAARCPQGMRAIPALGLLVVLAASLLSEIARGDEVSGLRSDKVFERRHRVEVTMDRGHATLVVRRTVENLGSLHDQVTFDIDVPRSAVAVALRTLGMSDGRPIWF